MVIVTPTLAEFALAHSLSRQQARIVGMVLQGHGNRSIAGKMGTTEQCIKNQLRFAYLKLNLAGDKNGKKLRLLIAVQKWAKGEKSKRVKERMQ